MSGPMSGPRVVGRAQEEIGLVLFMAALLFAPARSGGENPSPGAPAPSRSGAAPSPGAGQPVGTAAAPKKASASHTPPAAPKKDPSGAAPPAAPRRPAGRRAGTRLAQAPDQST